MKWTLGLCGERQNLRAGAASRKGVKRQYHVVFNAKNAMTVVVRTFGSIMGAPLTVNLY
jgi:hypothetical protein